MKNPSSLRPLVSICIPVFNSEKTIQRTINSIIAQTYTNIEIIVIDNCSTDATLKIVEEVVDPRIRIIRHDVHLPVAEYNWNRCFQYVHGEYMALFHADDVYSPLMVEHQINAFMEKPVLGGVFTSGNIINEKDEITGAFQHPPTITGGVPYSYKEILPRVLEYGDFFPCPTAMIPTTLYKTLAPFRYDQFGSASDLDMWLRVSQSEPVTILEEKLINYRISESQGTNSINFLRTREADIFRVLDFHLGQNDLSAEIPAKSIEIYETFRLEDVLIRARNLLIINDLEGFRYLRNSFSWTRHLRFALVHTKQYRHIFPKIFSLIFARVGFSLLGVTIMRMFFLDSCDRKRLYKK
jgi:glycosyltransferase involved in cell wall biosynthesis